MGGHKTYEPVIARNPQRRGQLRNPVKAIFPKSIYCFARNDVKRCSTSFLSLCLDFFAGAVGFARIQQNRIGDMRPG